MNVLAKLGYIGLFIGTFLSASVIPLPLSSDILLVGSFAPLSPPRRATGWDVPLPTA